MASLFAASSSFRIVSAARHECLAITQLPKIHLRLPPINSRASCFWSRSRFPQAPFSAIRQSRGSIGPRSQAVPFSTSLILRQQQNDGNPRPSEPVRETKPLSNQIPTLTSKLAPQRHEQIYNIPNALTLSRLLATPVIGYCILHGHHLYAFNLFLYAGFSDLLDGWIARKWHLQTVVGSVVDPMADKALMTTLVSTLALSGHMSLPLAALILGRDVSLAIAAIYYRYASLPAPKTFGRYWDFSLPSAEVHPTTISKLNTFLQLILIGTVMGVGLLHDPVALNSSLGGYLSSIQESLGGEDGVRTLVTSMSAVVAGTTMYSGLSYAWMKDAVTILGENEAFKKKQGFRGRAIIGVTFGGFIALAAWLAVQQLLREEEEATRDNRQ